MTSVHLLRPQSKETSKIVAIQKSPKNGGLREIFSPVHTQKKNVREGGGMGGQTEN